MQKNTVHLAPLRSLLLGSAFISVMALQPALGSSLTLDFTSATPGTVEDSADLGTGFTTRLSGTDSDNPDSRLTLNTGAGTLSIAGSSSGADFNGQSNVDLIEAPGINLSSLGFTGSQDFSLTATFSNVPAAAFNNYSQIGVYVGTASNNLTRDGFVYAGGAGGANYFTNVNTGGDASNVVAESFSAGDDLTVSISRTAGVFTETINGHSLAIPSNPELLFTGDTDLTVGVFSGNTVTGDSFTSTLDSFTVTVAPEPATWAMLLGGLAMLAALQRLRAGRIQV